MNIKQSLFEDVINTATASLKGEIHPSSLQNPEYEYYAKEYTDNLLKSIFHSTRDDYKTPRHALCNAFTGGFFCQLLNTLAPEENDDKTASILSILGGNVFTMEGRLVGLLLNSDAEVIKKQYEEMRNIVAHDCCQFLTYQNIAGAPYDELWTVCYAIFLVAASIPIDYQL